MTSTGAASSRPVVWVTADLAVPARAGGELRSLRLLSALAALTPVQVALLNPAADAEAVQQATGAVAVRQLPAWSTAVAKRTLALRRGWPLPTSAVHDRELAAWVLGAAGAGGIVVADHLQVAPYLAGAQRSVLSLHNDDAALLLQQRPAAGAARRLEQHWDRQATRRLQRRWLSRAQQVVCVSEQDRASLGRSDAVVVPNGADLPGRTSPVPAGGRLVFVGSLNYPPNSEAVRGWLREIAPLLPADLPVLTVVGRAARAILGDQPGLEIVADPPEVLPYLEQASVVVLPLRAGGGSRLKLIEAMALGRPVVSTTKGAEGFPVRHDRELLLADGPAEIAAAVTRVYRDPALAHRLATAGRAFAQAYSWEVLGARFAAAVLS